MDMIVYIPTTDWPNWFNNAYLNCMRKHWSRINAEFISFDISVRELELLIWKKEYSSELAYNNYSANYTVDFLNEQEYIAFMLRWS